MTYRNAQFVADQIFPTIPVLKQSDDYFVGGTDGLRSTPDLIVPRTRSNEAIMQRSPTPYTAKGHALSYPIPDEDRSNDDLGGLEIDATQTLMDKLLLNREIDVVARIQAGGVPVQDLSATAYANAFDNPAADPIAFIDAQALSMGRLTGLKPNMMVFSSQSLAGFRNNPNVKSRITGAPSLDGSAITLQQIANVLNLETVIEASSVQNTAKEGQADSLSYVWGKTALLLFKPKTPGLRTVSLGYNFMWNFPASPVAGGASKPVGDIVAGGAGYGVRMWYEQCNRTTMIEALMYYAQQIISANAGVYFANAVQGWN